MSNINILRDINITTSINPPNDQEAVLVNSVDYLSLKANAENVSLYGFKNDAWSLIATLSPTAQIIDLKTYEKIFFMATSEAIVRAVPIKSKSSFQAIKQRIKFSKGLSELSSMSDKDVPNGSYVKRQGQEDILSENIISDQQNLSLTPTINQVSSEYLFNNIYVINILGENFTKDCEIYIYENSYSESQIEAVEAGFLNHLDSDHGKIKDLVEIGLFSSKMTSVDFSSHTFLPDEGLVATLPAQTISENNPYAFVSSEIFKAAIEGVTGNKTYSILIKNSNGSYLFKDAINIDLTGEEPQVDDPWGDDDGDGIPNYLDLFPRFYGEIPEGVDIGEDAFGSLDLWFNMSSLPDIDVPLYYPYYKIDYDYPELKAYYMDDDNVVHDVTENIEILDTRSVVTGVGTTNTVRYFISNDRVPNGIELSRLVVVDRDALGEVTSPEFQVGLKFNIDPLPSITVEAGTDLTGFDYSIEGLKAIYGVGGTWITVSSEQNPISISVPGIDTTEGGEYDIEYSFTYEETEIVQIRKLIVDGDTEIKWKLSGIEIQSLESINFSQPVDYDILDFSEPQLSATFIRYDSEGVVQEEIDITSSVTEDSSSIPQSGMIPFGSYPYVFRAEYGVTKSYIQKKLNIMEVIVDQEIEYGDIVWTPKPTNINLSTGDAIPDLTYSNLSVKYVSPTGQEYALDHTKDIPSVSTDSVATFAASFTPVDTNGVVPFAQRRLLRDLTITISVSSPEIDTSTEPVTDNSYIEFEPSVLPAVITQDNVNFNIQTDFNNFEYPSLKAYHYDNDGNQTEITGLIEVIIPNKSESVYHPPYIYAFNQDGTIRNDYPEIHSILYKVEHEGKVKILKRRFEIQDTVAPILSKEPSDFVEKGTEFSDWTKQFIGTEFFGQDFPRVSFLYNPARTQARWSINITSNQFDNLDDGDTFTFSAETQDSYGNKTTMQKVITCRDTVAPTISFSSSLTFEPGATPTEQDMMVGFNVSDESSIASTSVVYSSVDFNTEGLYQAVYTAEDIHGNSKTQRRTVIVALPETTEEGADCLPTENIPPVQLTTKTVLSQMTDQDWIYPLKAAEGSTDITLSINVDYSTVNLIPVDEQGRVEYTVDGIPAVGTLPYQIRYTVQDLDNPDYEVCTVRPVTLVDAHEPYFTNAPTEININLNTSQVSNFDLMLSQIKEQLLSEDAITDFANLEYSTKEGLYSAEVVHGNSVQKTIIVTDEAGNTSEYGPVTINFSVTQLLRGFWEETVQSISFDNINSTLDNTAKYYGYGTFRNPSNSSLGRGINTANRATLSVWYQKTSNDDVSNRSKLVVLEGGDFRIEEDPKNNKYRVYDFEGNLAVEGTSDWASGGLRHVVVSNGAAGSFRVYSQGQKVAESYRPENVGTPALYAGGPRAPISNPTEVKNFLEYIPYLETSKGSFTNGVIEGSNPVRFHGQDPGTVRNSDIRISSEGIVSDEITFNFWIAFDKQTGVRKHDSITYLECGSLKLSYGDTHFSGNAGYFRSPDGIALHNRNWPYNTKTNPAMYTVTYSPTDGCKFYVNTTLKVQTAPSGNLPNWSDEIIFFRTGAFTGAGNTHANDWSGSLQVVNRVMSTTEIINLYNQGEAYEITPRPTPVIFEDYPMGAYGYVDSVEVTGSILGDNQIEELYYLGQDVKFSELAAKTVDQNEIETFLNNNVAQQQFYLDGNVPDSPDGNFIEFANALLFEQGRMIFTAANGYMTFNQPLDASGDFTIACWVTFAGLNGTLFYDSVNNISFLNRSHTYAHGTKYRLLSSEGNGEFSLLPNSGLNHLLMTARNGTIYLYLNGSGKGTAPQPSVGQITDIKAMVGDISEVRYWNVSMTEEQISMIYSNSKNY